MNYFYFSIFSLLFFSSVYSQQTGDSVLYVPIKDSIKTNDTVTSNTGDVNAIIEYSATDSAIFDISGDKLSLYNKAQLKYKEFDLKAARIILYRESSLMEAYGVPDTAKAGKFTGTPIFMEGSKRYDAFKLKYNFSTRKGNIEMGSTELEGGYYLGEKIKKVDDDVYFIQNGRYTTCDRADPHFYFGSPKMKVIQGDKVFAEPVYLHIDDVPVFVIPFGIFPNHSGRSSGLIPPAYGDDPTYGRYLAHLGYFWAISDYMDLALQGNYYTKGRIDLSGRYRYALRYKYSGTVDVGGSRIRLGEENDLDKVFSDEWRIGIYHNQTINPTTTFTANVNFLSSKNYYNTTTNNLNDLLQQNALSNITLNKYWEGTPNSMSIGYSRDQNLTTGEVRQVIPTITFARTQSFPFRGKNTSLLDLKWHENISYSYNSQLLYRDEKVLVNSAINDGNFTKNRRGGLKQFVNITAPIKVSEFSFAPYFNYNEIWYNKSIVKAFNPADSTVSINDVSGFKAYRFFNTGVTLNTRLIGIFNTRIFGVKGFRHTLTPSLSYTYTPDFSESKWNIYGSYTGLNGQQFKYSFYEREVFGTGIGTGETQSLSFNVSNVFEMKVKDTDSTDTKFQLLNFDAGISYNFAADSLNFSDISLGYRTQIGNFLNIGGGAYFSLYKFENGTRVNKYLLKEEGRLAQLTSFNISLSTSLQGGQDETTDTTTDHADDELGGDEYVGIYNDTPPDFSIPWSVGLSYNYNIDRRDPNNIFKYSNISGNLAFNLTRNWKFTFSTAYDIFQKQFAAPYITVYRDLHCWEMSLNWYPTGIYRGYRFEIRIKAPQLQDVKYNRQSNYRGVY